MTIVKTLVAAVLLGLLASCTTTSSSTGGPVKAYTSNLCIVTDNELGSMGKPISYVHGDQEVKFCCKPCIKKFRKNPEKYLASMPK